MSTPLLEFFAPFALADALPVEGRLPMALAKPAPFKKVQKFRPTLGLSSWLQNVTQE